MFEVSKIDEIIQSLKNLKTESHNLIKEPVQKGKKCIYFKDMECTAPNCKMKICANCPYGYLFTIKSLANNLFRKIVGLAIFLMKGNNAALELKKSEGTSISQDKNG